MGEAFTRSPGAAWATGYCRIIGGDGAEIRSPITAYKNLLLRRWSLPLYLTQNFVSDPATFVRRERSTRWDCSTSATSCLTITTYGSAWPGATARR